MALKLLPQLPTRRYAPVSKHVGKARYEHNFPNSHPVGSSAVNVCSSLLTERLTLIMVLGQFKGYQFTVLGYLYCRQAPRLSSP